MTNIKKIYYIKSKDGSVEILNKDLNYDDPNYIYTYVDVKSLDIDFTKEVCNMHRAYDEALSTNSNVAGIRSLLYESILLNINE